MGNGVIFIPVVLAFWTGESVLLRNYVRDSTVCVCVCVCVCVVFMHTTYHSELFC